MNCEICELEAKLRKNNRITDLGPHWTINTYEGPGTRPRWVIQSKRHVTSISRLHDGELASLGRSIGHAVREIERADPDVEKVHVASFNETAPGHPHVHLIARFKGETTNPYELNESPLRTLSVPPEDICARLAPTAERISHGVGIVAGARTGIAFWNQRLSLYKLFTKVSSKRRSRRFDAGERYVLFWLGTLIAIAIVLGALNTAGLIRAGLTDLASYSLGFIAAYRLVDIAVYSLGILLTTYQSALQSVARSLILFLLNLLEISLITVIFLLASGNEVIDSLVSAAGLVTSSGVGGHVNSEGLALMIPPAAVTLEVFALGIGMIMGKVGETFTDQSR